MQTIPYNFTIFATMIISTQVLQQRRPSRKMQSATRLSENKCVIVRHPSLNHFRACSLAFQDTLIAGYGIHISLINFKAVRTVCVIEGYNEELLPARFPPISYPNCVPLYLHSQIHESHWLRNHSFQCQR